MSTADLVSAVCNSVVTWLDAHGDKDTRDGGGVECRGKLGDFEVQMWSAAGSTDSTLDIWHRGQKVVGSLTWNTEGGDDGCGDVDMEVFRDGEWLNDLLRLTSQPRVAA